MNRPSRVAVDSDALRSRQRRTIPHIRETVWATKLAPHGRPLCCRHGFAPVNREVRSPTRFAVPVGVLLKPLEHLRRRIVPEMTLVEIFPHCGVSYPAGFICFAKWESCTLPFGQKPFLKWQSANGGLIDILDAHLRDDRKSADLGGVHISGDVRLPLVPDVGVYIPPAALLQNRMNGSPTDFGVPKPECGHGRSSLCPCLDVGLVPFGQVQ